MGQNSVKAYGAKGRKDALPFDPEDIMLVTDTSHPLYDERVHIEPERWMVDSIKTYGVIEPIIVRKNGERDGKPVIECIAGRQRVKACRVANKELTSEGKSVVDVYALIRRGTDAELAEVAVVENEARRGDDPITRARKMQRLVDLGRDEKRIATVFCCSVGAVKNCLALLDLDVSVQKAVETNAIGSTFAVQEFTKLPREEQKTKLSELVENGVTKGAAAKEAIRQIKNGEKPTKSNGATHKMRSRIFLERLSTELRKSKQTESAALIDFILGSDTALMKAKELREVAVAAGWKRKENG